MASDGNYIIDTKINSSGLQSDLKDVAKQFDKVADAADGIEKEANKSFEGISDSARKAYGKIENESEDGSRKVIEDLQEIEKEAGEAGRGVKDGFEFGFESLLKAELFSGIAVDALKKVGEMALEVAKQAVQASAEIKAENAQFAQTFKGVEKTAREALEGIADETGITASRMQKSYTSIYAFTKSVGAQTKAALDISSRAMRAAADSAAYYDVSVEEATETLQSFLKGNYENDAALGIAATETTRNAKANEMYAKSFDRLAESQKVDVLLAMVEAGNEASGAMGQAAREADSWGNVTGELSEAWRQLLGVIGDPIIETLTPIIKGITWALQETGEAIKNSNMTGYITDFDLALQSGMYTTQALGDVVADTPIEDEMANWEMAAESTAATVEQLRLEYDEARTAARQSLETQIGLFDELAMQSDMSAAKIIKNWQSQQQGFANYADNLQKAVNMGLDEALVQQLSDGSTESMSILHALVNDTSISIDDINAEFKGVSESRETVAAVMADIQTDMSTRLAEMKANIKSEYGEMSGVVGEEIGEMQKYINSLTGSTVYVDVITRYFDEGPQAPVPNYSSGNATEPAAANVMPANVPYLATGAVIPPRSPFLAVLGDQRSGTNIEAPLETIKQALAEVMAVQGLDIGIEFRGDMAALARILTPIITKEQRRNTIARGL